MNKLPIKKVVEGLLKLQDTGESATLLGIGPMSPNLLQASFEIARDYDFPLMFIASRNQVDADELGGGYVNGWIRNAFRTIYAQLLSRLALMACIICAGIMEDHGKEIMSGMHT